MSLVLGRLAGSIWKDGGESQEWDRRSDERRSLVDYCTYSDTCEGQLEELRRAVGAHGAEGDVVDAEVFRARQRVRVGVKAANQFAQNYSCETKELSKNDIFSPMGGLLTV